MDDRMIVLFDLVAERIAAAPVGDRLLCVVTLLTAIAERGVDLSMIDDCISEAITINLAAPAVQPAALERYERLFDAIR